MGRDSGDGAQTTSTSPGYGSTTPATMAPGKGKSPCNGQQGHGGEGRCLLATAPASSLPAGRAGLPSSPRRMPGLGSPLHVLTLAGPLL